MANCRMLSRTVLGIGLAVVVSTSTGCVGFLAQMLYFANGGDKLPADFEGLKGKRIAIVCVSASSTYGQDATAKSLAKAVGQILSKKVEGIKVIHQDEIANWMDNHDNSDLDYRQIGKGVKAEMVLVISLNSLSLYEGQTLYKGRASALSKVYDLKKDGEIVFERRLSEFTYPANGNISRIDKSEMEFRSELLIKLAQQLARPYHEVDVQDNFARDVPALQF